MKNLTMSSFTRFFKFFPKLFVAGLMFSIPLAFFTALFALLSWLISFNNIIVWGLSIIPSFPFYAGLVMVIRKYSIEKVEPPLFSTFFSAVKDNYKRFLLHGVILYIICACGTFSLMYYYTQAQQDIVFSSVFTLYLIFVVLLVVMMFYVPIMDITYELKFFTVYKNSFLLIFGKILRNLIALICVAIVTAAAVLCITFSKDTLFYVVLGIITIFYPLLFCYISNSIIAKGLIDTVGDFVNKERDQKIFEEQQIENEKKALDSASNDSDYVFVNGKMIKRTQDTDNSHK